MGDETYVLSPARVFWAKQTGVTSHPQESASCDVCRRGRECADSRNLIRVRTTTLSRHCVAEELYRLVDELAFWRTEHVENLSGIFEQGANVFQV